MTSTCCHATLKKMCEKKGNISQDEARAACPNPACRHAHDLSACRIILERSNWTFSPGQCRFGAGCTNAACLFEHAPPAQVPPARVPPARVPPAHPKVSHSSETECKYGPGCTKRTSGCPYAHTPTKDCKYGGACTKQDGGCTFRHPPQVECKYGPGCTKRTSGCPYAHTPTKDCKFGGACTKQDGGCNFRHPPRVPPAPRKPFHAKSRIHTPREKASTPPPSDVSAPSELDCYDLLGVTSDATLEEIKAAYKRCAREFHPDKNGACSPEVKAEREERFKDIANAYAVLSDPQTRAAYDAKEEVVVPNIDDLITNLFETFFRK